MEKIDQILGSAMAKKGLAAATKAAQICFYADEWGGNRFQAISFLNGILKLSVSSSSAASEIHFCQESLIDYINKKLGRKTVKRLKIEVK